MSRRNLCAIEGQTDHCSTAGASNLVGAVQIPVSGSLCNMRVCALGTVVEYSHPRSVAAMRGFSPLRAQLNRASDVVDCTGYRRELTGEMILRSRELSAYIRSETIFNSRLRIQLTQERITQTLWRLGLRLTGRAQSAVGNSGK